MRLIALFVLVGVGCENYDPLEGCDDTRTERVSFEATGEELDARAAELGVAREDLICEEVCEVYRAFRRPPDSVTNCTWSVDPTAEPAATGQCSLAFYSYGLCD